jgi:hypothetical protein
MKRLRAGALFVLTSLVASMLVLVIGAPPAAACIGSCGLGSMYLDFEPGPYEYGRPLTVRAYVSDLSGTCAIVQVCDAPTGSVEMYRDGAGPIIAQGTLHPSYPDCMYTQCGDSETYELRTAVLGAGTFDVVAKYVPSGEHQFDVDDERKTVTIPPAWVSFSAHQSSSTSEIGEPVTLTATVEPREPSRIDLSAGAHLPGGYVLFSIDQQPWFSAALGTDGVAKVTTTSLPAGTHEWTAEYHPDPDYRPPSFVITSSHTVTTPVPSPPDLALTQSATTSVFGEPVTLTATASAPGGRTAIPTGQMDFVDGRTTIGTAPLSGGDPDKAAVVSSALTVGSHALHAHYGGDGRSYLPTDSATITHDVTQAATATAFSSPSPNPHPVGDPVTLRAHVSVTAPGAGTPTGTVTFKDGGATLGTPIALPASGDVEFSTTFLTGGSHSITASYSGEGNFTSSTSAPTVLSSACTTTFDGYWAGSYTVSASGTTCFVSAYVGGDVTVPPGARVLFTNTTVARALNASGGLIIMCGSSIGTASTLSGAGPLTLGDVDRGCAGNAFNSSVQLLSTKGGLRFMANSVRAGLTVTGTQGGPTVIGGNSVGGSLTCNRNNPTAVNGGRPNGAGARFGECAAAGF